jgi:hypothetical protein
MYKFGKQSSIDPTSQTEDIGNSSMKASSYGLKNLEYVRHIYQSGLVMWLIIMKI